MSYLSLLGAVSLVLFSSGLARAINPSLGKLDASDPEKGVELHVAKLAGTESYEFVFKIDVAKLFPQSEGVRASGHLKRYRRKEGVQIFYRSVEEELVAVFAVPKAQLEGYLFEVQSFVGPIGSGYYLIDLSAFVKKSEPSPVAE